MYCGAGHLARSAGGEPELPWQVGATPHPQPALLPRRHALPHDAHRQYSCFILFVRVNRFLDIHAYELV
jgi:hypothetical protein